MSRDFLKGSFIWILYYFVRKNRVTFKLKKMWWSQDFIYDPRVQNTALRKVKKKKAVKDTDIMWS